ncbi:MAG: DUF6282 family protein [Clostridium sp.]|nr:DUF6282 family protein [Clostridium sp.]
MGLITMEGACDLHIHTSPDIFERIADDVRTAEVCRDAGMKAIVFKCHADTTVTRAWHTQRQVPGIQVFGGIVLNLNVGGINPAAVDVALKMGAVEVWMPSYHSLAHYKATGKMGGYGHQGADVTTNYPVEPITILDEKGELIPQIWPILEMIKQYDAILGTSHLGAEEGLKLIRAAREVGCCKVVLTHPFFAPPSCTIDQIKEAVELGAFCEFCSGNALSPIPAPIPLELYKEAVDACGSENFIISSDTGHPRKTMAPETSRMFAQSLTYKGVKQADVEWMLKDNYYKLLNFE